ncbi:hypothetical protein GSI_01985 [Ganoderma sinense ZZ0214-1]|uniref:Uncharacterized protein n=1 Tax=Ganoderma sinense ZZ0214-1 TaxID=1077348 RepID=A0A2G8SNC8_9APHY|nr:hypothetical protein GSI_01985 [Ganoderma sinense ZZ0214-1]
MACGALAEATVDPEINVSICLFPERVLRWLGVQRGVPWQELLHGRVLTRIGYPASITIAFDYSDNNVADLTAVPRPDPKWLRVTVEGEHAITHMFLPTVPLQSLADTDWQKWITTIQGPEMGRCDVTATQRQLLLDIALTYRAFTSGNAGVDNIWFTNFTRTLINIARSHKNKTIDAALTYLTSALHAIFNSPDIPPVTHDPQPPIDVPASRSASGGGAPASASATGAHGVPTPLPTLDEIYGTVPRRGVDEGYDSDEDTIPSLRTVGDSSDDSDIGGDDSDFY